MLSLTVQAVKMILNLVSEDPPAAFLKAIRTPGALDLGDPGDVVSFDFSDADASYTSDISIYLYLG